MKSSCRARARNPARPLVFVVAVVVLLSLAASTTFAQSAFAQSAAPAATQAAGSPPASADLAPGHAFHSVTVKFDYDFTTTPACSEKLHEHCVRRFVAYDISAGLAHRAKLFTIPVPDGAKGQVRSITATSPKLDFESGKHQLAVTAQEASGVESRHYAATVWVVIP